MMSNRDFLYLVLIAVTWFMTIAFVASALYILIGVREQADLCIAAQERAIENCTIKLPSGKKNETIFNITPLALPYQQQRG